MMSNSMRLRAALLALALAAAACGSETTTATEPSAADSSDADSGESADGMEAMDDDAMDDMDHGDDHGDMDHGDDHGGGHDHGGGLEVPESMAVPTISIAATPDPISGHNVSIDLTDFEITPENASTDPIDGQGHLHLYIDGERVSRFYNTAIHLDGLEPGEHTVMIEVSANSHAAYVVDGEPIMAMATITVEDGGDADLVDSPDIDGGDASIEVSATADPRGGWNVEFTVDGFELDAANAGGDAVAGSGHIMLIVDGVEIGRQYGSDVYISALDSGDHEITAELRHNDTSPYLVDGAVVSASTTVTEEEMEAMESTSDTTVIEVSVVDGSVETDSDRVEVELGSWVQVIVEANPGDEIHVHGYDLYTSVGSGSTGMVMFEADVPGVFEVEIEESGLFLFEIQVG